MARRLRVHIPGGFYHVTLRGNHRQSVFFRDADYALLEVVVSETITSLRARIHAYCWMTNHVHLLVQVSDVPLGKVIHQIASRYARTVQLRLKTTGHLFERRYHARLVDADRYLLTLIRYIHLNPVEGSIVSAPDSYQWSSHRVYLGLSSRPWVSTSFVMRMLATTPERAVLRYRELIDDSQPDKWGPAEMTPHPRHPDILGDDDFVRRIALPGVDLRSRKSLEDLVQDCSRRFDVSLESLASRHRTPRLVAARAWLGHEAVDAEAATISAIARLLKRTEGSLRYLMRRYPKVAADP